MAAAELGSDLREVAQPLVCVQAKKRQKVSRHVAAAVLGEVIWGEQLLQRVQSKERSDVPRCQQRVLSSGAASTTRVRTSQSSTCAVAAVDPGAQAQKVLDCARSQKKPAAFGCQQRCSSSSESQLSCQQRRQQRRPLRHAGAVTVTPSLDERLELSSGESSKPRPRNWVPHCAQSGCSRRGVFCSIGLAKVRWCGAHRPITASRRCDRT